MNPSRSKKNLYLSIVLGGLFAIVLCFFSSRSNFFSSSKNHVKNLGDNVALQKHYKDLINSLGAKKAYSIFLKENQDHPYPYQHIAAHSFGIALYSNEGLKGITICDDSFAYGCYHSFFGEAIDKNGLGILPELSKECIKHFTSQRVGCPHGIGHGLLYYMGSDHLSQALNQCTVLRLPDSLNGCTSGVFMEYNLNILKSSYGNTLAVRPFVENERHFPCATIGEQYRQTCYFNMPQWWIMSFGSEDEGLKKATVYCNEVTDTVDRNTCFLGLGSMIAPIEKYNVNQSIKKCQELSSETKVSCQAGAAVGFYFDPRYRKISSQLCNQLSVSDHTLCVSTAENLYVL